MIKIKDEYEIEHDGYCWNLRRFYFSKNPKTGEETRRFHTTYHSNLEQVAKWVIERECVKCAELEDILHYLKIRSEQLSEELEKLNE